MAQTLSISAPSLDQLASGLGDADCIAILRSGQLSRRMVLLAKIADAANHNDAETYFALLSEAHCADPKSTEQILLQPPVGAWCVTAWRAARTGPSSVMPHLNYLGGIAAAAAIRAELDFEISVTSHSGSVMIPGYGLALVPPGPCRIQHADRKLSMPAIGELTPDNTRWQPLRHIESTANGLTIRVALNDIDPYRASSAMSASPRLSDDQLKYWQLVLDQTWDVLTEEHQAYAVGIGAGLNTFVPLEAPDSGYVQNATSMDSFGAVLLSLPPDHLSLASSLLHEFQHAKLGALLDLIPLHESDSQSIHYAPWRDDPRPMAGVLHGVYAFLGEADFYRVQRHTAPPGPAKRAEFDFARCVEMLSLAIDLLQESAQLTAAGQQFLESMARRQKEWLAEGLDPQAAEWARQVTLEHRLVWRLRHCVPQAESIDQLHAMWRADRATPAMHVPVAVIADDTARLVHNVRLDLARIALADPYRFERICTDPGTRAAELPELTAADAAYAHGDLNAARAGYLDEIEHNPNDYRAWAGLAMSSPEVTTLTRSPELVHAVHRKIVLAEGHGPDVLVLARWLNKITIGGA